MHVFTTTPARLIRTAAWLLAVGALAVSGAAAQDSRAPDPVYRQSFDAWTPPDGAQVRDEDGIAGPYARLEGAVDVPRVDLPREISGDYTLAGWIRATEWLDQGPSGFGSRVPPTILALYDSETSTPIVFRVHHRTLQLAVNRDGQWDSASGWSQLPAGQWVHAAVVRRGETVRFFLNGVPEVTARLHRCTQPLVFARVGTVWTRTFYGDIDEVSVWDRALTAEELAGMVSEELRRRVDAFSIFTPPDRHPSYPGRALRLRDGERAPLVAGLAARCLAVPWYGTGRSDLLCHGIVFNGHASVWRERAPGMYEPGVPLADLAPGSGLPEPPFYRVDRAPGLFDIISTGRRTPLEDHLLYHRNIGQPGAPAFAPPRSIPCNGLVFRQAYHASPTAFQDIDGDGVVDMIIVRGHKGASYPPDAPDHFWTGADLPSTGKGRGYSINGHWLGYESRHLLEWVRGVRTVDGELAFGEKRLPIYVGAGDFPLQWKGYGSPRAAWVEIGGATWLVLAGNIDEILAVPARLEGDIIRCGPARDLLAGTRRLRTVYYPHAVDVRDIDGDSAPELLLSGNPGRLAILRGDRVGAFREEPAYQVGGHLAMETLTVPCRVDWDGDGSPDIIAGDASGYLMVWPGTADPMVYRSPSYMHTPAGQVHIQAGYDGSIQGPNEARWGYLNPTVGDWDLDGEPDIISCDINADMLWFRPRGDDPAALHDPVAFTSGAARLPVAWRQRPAILPPAFGLAGDRPCLLHMNWDGVLSVGVPAATGSTDIVEQRSLVFTDGSPVKLDGPGGLWGRAKFAVTDWDGDGIWDVVFGTNRSDHQFFTEEHARRESMPFLLRNAGTAAAPVLDRPVPITLGDEFLAFGTHIAAVWPTDMDGDGREDLIIGAEDGCVYRFLRQELRP